MSEDTKENGDIDYSSIGKHVANADDLIKAKTNLVSLLVHTYLYLQNSGSVSKRVNMVLEGFSKLFEKKFPIF